MILSPRLQIIADSIHDFETVADIGSDHAFLPIYLVQNELVKKAVATDINKGPTEISRDRIKAHGVEAKVSVRQGNGLSVIKPGEAEVVVIAGMGGILISDILDKNPKVAKSAKLLILQPMRDSDKVRKWILEHGFDIIDEELVKDNGKIYEVIWSGQGGKTENTRDLLLIGDKVIKKKHPLLAEFINGKIRELEKVIASIEDIDSENCRMRAAECREVLSYYREAAKWVR